ncbi:MAG: hypothetical protein ABSH41_16280 [Syntrophobacteraceae bacterium]|jgi:DNA polymerase I-like protein with 3'-5' exonuclease and polymerase domains
MELKLSNCPCTSSLMGCRELTHVLSILSSHDEIIVEARDAIEEQVEAIVKGAMEGAFEKIVPEVRLIVEPKIADSWKA